MNANPMNNNMANTLYGNARSITNLHFGSSSINGLIAIHYKLILQSNKHIFLKYYPQRLCLDDTITKCPRFGVHRIIRRVSDLIYSPILPSNGIFAIPNGTIC
ncbi:Folate-biopterin transporter 1, chloroplastic [Senna tora]|uniref:Folate-biopterin transporter 1, chloroplastic n=1 Tax=Senna tora TaxID=362788 RepID=A0A834XAP7_9FABA|nr:Folate-biopterin transporter 1, chloroplastic [Senna tora]